MKLENIKDKIDNYFDNVSAEEIIERFKQYGYTFVPIEESEYEVTVHSTKIINTLNQAVSYFGSFESSKDFKNDFDFSTNEIEDNDYSYDKGQESDISLAA